MRLKLIVIIVTFSLLLVGFLYLTLKKTEISNENIGIDQIEIKEETIPSNTYTEDQWKEIESIQNNPFVKQVRIALDGYLSETYEGILEPHELVTDTETFENNKICGLDSFDKDYYKSKFIIIKTSPADFGGTYIDIVFIDKPDQEFSAWIYKGAEKYDMRMFCNAPSIKESDIRDFINKESVKEEIKRGYVL